MEGIFFLLIGGALFAQSWYILGLYSEGRTMGIFVGGLGLLSLGTLIWIKPTLLTAIGEKGKEVAARDVLMHKTVISTVIVAWSLYAVGVASHGLWDLDERAIGFYSIFLAVATLGPFVYFAVALGPPDLVYAESVWLGMWIATLVLAIVAAIMFFYLAIACRWSTIMSVVNRSGKMSVHERIDIDPERTGKAPSAQRYPGRSDISG